MDLRTFFNPSSIAVIGVSHDPKKVGYLVLKNILHQGFEGELYAINPKGGHILGQKVYENFSQIQRPVDMAILCIPGLPSLQIIEELGKAGVKNVVLYAAGFKEVGGDGIELENRLIALSKEYGMHILGPNCIGFISTKSHINATFLRHDSPFGNIGLLSQSGALGSVMVDYFASHENLGFSYCASLGNKAVIDECDVLEYLSDDEQTKVIAMYIEDVKDGERFMKTLAQATQKKPVIVLKSGRTNEGSKAAASHTGGLVGNDQVYDSVFKECGAIRAEGLEEFLMLLKIASYEQMPQDDQILVLSNAGGAGVLVADDIITQKLSLPALAPELVNALSKEEGGKKITLHNPVDLLGDASAVDYSHALDTAPLQKNTGAIMILLTPQANTEIKETAEIIGTYKEKTGMPIYPIFMGEESIMPAQRFFEEQKIASFISYDGLSKALKKLIDYQRFLSKKRETVSPRLFSLAVVAKEKDITTLLSNVPENKILSFKDSLDILENADITIAKTRQVFSATEAIDVAHSMKYPIVAKVASRLITHKTEEKGVYVGIQDDDELKHIYEKLTSIKGSKGCYIQKQVTGYELFVGAKRDPHFGTVLVLGTGGIYAELFKDVSERIYPFGQSELLKMLEETKAGQLLSGFRNGPVVAPISLHSILMSVGALMDHFPQISELDINPLMVTASGLVAVDSRIILK